jgi:hypothetical protein
MARLELVKKSAVKQWKKCPFPGCTRFEHLEGEHQLGRPEYPSGGLRLLQRLDPFLNFNVPCDLCDAQALGTNLPMNEAGRLYWESAAYIHHPPAQAFYADSMGYGWALCDWHTDQAEDLNEFARAQAPKLHAEVLDASRGVTARNGGQPDRASARREGAVGDRLEGRRAGGPQLNHRR